MLKSTDELTKRCHGLCPPAKPANLNKSWCSGEALKALGVVFRERAGAMDICGGVLVALGSVQSAETMASLEAVLL